MTKLDDLTREAIEELQGGKREEENKKFGRWGLDTNLLVENLSRVLSNDAAFGVTCLLNPSIIKELQMLMYLAFKVGEKKGRGDMLEELMGG